MGICAGGRLEYWRGVLRAVAWLVVWSVDGGSGGCALHSHGRIGELCLVCGQCWHQPEHD